MAQLIGNRYELIEQIGAGGMGVVYRGVDRQSQALVAIKQLRPDVTSPDIIERFKREGESLRQLNHPNIVKLLDTVEQDRKSYLILEYVQGGDLYTLMRLQRLPLDRVLAIGLDLADALLHAHRLKILHRDLKPANILLADDGSPRLTDFGVAKWGNTPVTKEGHVLGTLAYLSPEALNNQPLDERSDLWAFGVMLFELITGRHPFPADQVGAQVAAILLNTTPDLEALRPDLPVALVDLVYRMLEKDTERRIASARLVGAELETILRAYHPTVQADRTSVEIVSGVLPADLPTLFKPHMVGVPTSKTDHLPAQTTPFVGREDELAMLAHMLSDSHTRLITILAPGGMGKTRLAMQAAHMQSAQFGDGAWFVPLSQIAESGLMLSITAEALNFPFYSDRAPEQQLLDYLREKSMLIVFDNCEHVLDGVVLLTAILEAAPGVKIIASSRERLNLQSEVLFRLEGMALQDWQTLDEALDSSAVRLFLNSARRVQPSFGLDTKTLDYLSDICRQMQGMPLGIILAAAWVNTLTLKEIAEEIAKSVDFLESTSRDLPLRQRSIRAVFDYSWNLLAEQERSVFAQLSIFRGGFTREAAQAVTGASLRTLGALVNKSMLRRSSDGRFEIHELLKQYGLERLARDQRALHVASDKHCTYYAEWVNAMGKRLHGPYPKEAHFEFGREMTNILLAWETAVNQTDVRRMRLLVFETVYFLNLNRLVSECANMVQAVATVVPGTDEVVDGLILLLEGLQAGFASSPRAPEIQHQSYQLLRQQGAFREAALVCTFTAIGLTYTTAEFWQEAAAMPQSPDDSWLTVYLLWSRWDLTQQSSSELDALTTATADRMVLMTVYNSLAGSMDSVEAAAPYLYKSLSLSRELGSRVFELINLNNIANLLILNDRYHAIARQLAEEAFDGFNMLNHTPGKTYTTLMLGQVDSILGHYQSAIKRLSEVLIYYRQSIRRQPLMIALLAYAYVLIKVDQLQSAEAILREALERLTPGYLPTHLVTGYQVECITHYGNLYAQAGRGEHAGSYLSWGSARLVELKDMPLVERFAREYTEELRTLISPTAFDAAWEYGKTLALETIVIELLANPIFPQSASVGT